MASRTWETTGRAFFGFLIDGGLEVGLSIICWPLADRPEAVAGHSAVRAVAA